jgi:hypothetical protein
VAEAPEPLDVVLLVEREMDLAVRAQRDAVVWAGQVLGAEPEVDAVARVFWNRVGLGSRETAISATLLCRM